MKNRCKSPGALTDLQEKLAGLGEYSTRKTYYPELQQRLEELERFKAFIDNSNDAIFLIEVPTGRIVDVNDSACRQTGWSREEFLEASFFDISDLDACPNAEKLVTAPADNGVGQALAVADLYRKDEGRIPAELTLNRMNFRDKAYVLVAARDITERKQLEAQLLQSQKMEAIGQLAGGVAHDFNNILMVIMGYGSVLKMDMQLDAHQKQQVEHIIDAADKAAQLTQSLLEFSRKQVIKPRTANLNDIVQHLQSFLARIIGEDVKLKSILTDAFLPARVDSSQIEQVLINLATNARDAMPTGGVLTIETGLQDVDSFFVRVNGFGEPGRYALISVSDTGTGMDEQTRNRIFEPFFTTKEVGKGTGLGMAIVHKIVRQHDGFIHVYSEPGIGTTFRIYIPLVGKDAAADEEAGTPAPPKGGMETILVAEDEASVRGLLGELLASFGYEVILAEDGRDAVEKFAANRQRVKLVLMDVVMPKMSGREAGNEIRRLDTGVRIIYSSGYAPDIAQNSVELDEGAELVTKPVHPYELLRKVREVLDRQ